MRRNEGRDAAQHVVSGETGLTTHGVPRAEFSALRRDFFNYVKERRAMKTEWEPKLQRLVDALEDLGVPAEVVHPFGMDVYEVWAGAREDDGVHPILKFQVRYQPRLGPVTDVCFHSGREYWLTCMFEHEKGDER